MALINPDFHPGPTLVVGDGNFSFSLCLAEALGDSIDIYATSLDTREQLATNTFALDNLKQLSRFKNTKVIHGVDATELEKTFQSCYFPRIIFNFPHTGGKLKISNCRKLLENFFVSAAQHLEPLTGVVCVSLCQGQGGTPRDTLQRERGNTWQVVEQAAKAGFILKDILPFRECDYPNYDSAGFKGSLSKNFCTSGGLTHVFILGTPLDDIPSVSSFLKEAKKEPTSDPLQLHLNPNHPMQFIKRKIEDTFKELSIPATNIKGFAVLTNGCYDKTKIDVNASQEVNNSTRTGLLGSNREINNLEDTVFSNTFSHSTSDFSLYNSILHCVKKNHGNMVVSGTESDFSVPVTSSTHPISHKIAILRTDPGETTSAKLKKELEFACQKVIDDVFSHLMMLTDKPRHPCSSESTFDLGFTKSELNTFKPADYQALRQRIKKPNEWRPECRDTPQSPMPLDCCCINNEEASICTCCALEAQYFCQKMNFSLAELVDNETKAKFYCDDKLIMSCGNLNLDVLQKTTDLLLTTVGWIILLDLDALTMALHDIQNRRMLWSTNERFMQQFSDKKSSESPVQFIPFSLYPPLYLHDISFWLSEGATEEVFLSTVHQVTQNCVCDVWFREKYVDKVKCTVSYNYRMIYSRCDGPLSHLQSVELQNVLRRVLLENNFLLS